MKSSHIMRLFVLLLPGALLFQNTQCLVANELLQTTFLAITAAGAIAILDNI